MDRAIMKEKELRDVYYDPSEGYRSAEKLYEKLKENHFQERRSRMAKIPEHVHEI